ncbi:hypothetical protein H257_03778 [Aphanomyces astaci]|uniref:Fibronectin type-III domain-containing protein n=1 Tax=Aphanomyces astaci TaxID=112090 RepID=W4H0F1_APHAT|nr:hypothetical protein H257_03778 [Aphanomyces astaci]ETV84628.1 hypothetical protein H257_03778 [Aphanomyces astaci]|eukprot:XP_009826320.1 hypothetical protein H257_03778 [Aphanomyces astaci]
MPYTNVSTLDPDDEGNEPWRVTLLRALIHGDYDIMVRDVTSNVASIAQKLTTHMSRGKLEWETVEWWQLQDATPLFVAAVFGHPKLVRWLLKHGAERSTTCYLGQTALDLCGEHATDAAAVDECRRLLKEPPKIPDPPGKPSFQCHITTDHVFRHIQVAEESDKGVLRLVEKRVPHVVRKCVASLRWTTPLSNGKMIEKYEARYRTHVPGDKSMVRGWRSQTTAHSRLQDAQGCTVDGLQLGTTYEVQCRAQNAVGRGDWCAIELLITPSVERGGGDSEENESDDTNHGDGS